MKDLPIRSLLSIVALIFILSLPLWLKPYVIRGISMQDTYQAGDVVLTDALSLYFFPPQRGELVLFDRPKRTADEPSQIDIKRVVGLPGETVRVLPDRVIIDRPCGDVICSETFATSSPIGRGGNGYSFDMQLGEGEYFMLGDNRKDSNDSRYRGPVERSALLGRALMKIWHVPAE